MKYEMKVRVNTRLRIRTGPSLSYKIIGHLYNNNTIITTEERNGWYKHNKGWSNGDYLVLVKDLSEKPIKVEPIPPEPPITSTGTPPKPYTPPDLTVPTISTKKQVNSDFMTRSMKDSLASLGYYTSGDIDKFNKFNRFGYKEFNGIRTTREYLFFTKPDLNILNSKYTLNPDIASDAIIYEIFSKHPDVVYQLQSSINANGSAFMNLLSNTVKSKLEMPSISSKEIETSATQFGSRMFYKKHSFESDENFDFSLDFEDVKSLEVYDLFKLWDHYSNLKSIGVVKPKDEYRESMEIHDQISIYKFIVDETNSNILFYAKVTGCFTKGAPREAFSDVGDKLLYSVPFKGHFVEDSNPLILTEFNILSNNKGKELPLYDIKNGRVDGRWGRSAYVQKHEYSTKKGFVYKLKWKG